MDGGRVLFGKGCIMYGGEVEFKVREIEVL
jgi:hypothetical protein